MPSKKTGELKEGDMIKLPFLPHLSHGDNWEYFLIRLACSHEKLFDTCIIPRCRRYKRCDTSHEEWKSGKNRFPLCPPCVRTETERDEVIKRLKFIVDECGKYCPIYGKHLFSWKLPPLHRSRQ